MIYSWRGVGKSLFALSMAHSIACGAPFAHWSGSNIPRRICYFDGEMHLGIIKSRLLSIMHGSRYDCDADSIGFVCPESTGGIFWNLGLEHHREYYLECCKDSDVVIFDTLTSCVRPVPKKDKLSVWAEVQEWLIKLRDLNKTIFIIHHEGKNGTQRGFSDFEDPLDFCLHLEKPPSWKPLLGADFVLHFEKFGRGQPIGNDGESKSITCHRKEDGSLFWNYSDYVDPQNETRGDIHF